MVKEQEQITPVTSYIPAHLASLHQTLPDSVTLVCISKFQPVDAIRAAYHAGERHFGESRVQELKEKVAQLPDDIHWHFIGHLQTNKVRDLLRIRPYLIQSVDSERLLRAINDEAARLGIVQDVLLEVHVAKEETKTGFTPEEITNLQSQIIKYPNVQVRGLMTMATNTDDEQEIRRCFMTAKSLYDTINDQMENDQMVNLSMGMSDDYRMAIECGANMIRIGSSIFGERTTVQSPKIRAVFFDQDGILFNSMPCHAQAWVDALSEQGIPYTALECYRNEGRTGSGVIQELYQRLHGTDPSQELIDTIYSSKSAHFIRMTKGELPELIPGVKDVLTFLHQHGIQCWVVTGSGQRNLINSLNDTFDHVFTGIVSAFDVTHGKPDPEPYLKAWERSGFRKDECMVVENAPLGVHAAKAAGLFTCAVNTGILPDSDLAAEHPDRIFHSMKELLEWLSGQIQ